jgi:hypothetical protein
MMILGFAGIGVMAYRRKNNQNQMAINAAKTHDPMTIESRFGRFFLCRWINRRTHLQLGSKANRCTLGGVTQRNLNFNQSCGQPL